MKAVNFVNRFTVTFVALTLMLVSVLSISTLPVRAATVSICNTGDTVNISPSTKNFVVQNNIWNDVNGSQCLSVDDQTGNFTVTSANHNKGSGAPAAYPSIFKGCHWGNCTNNSGMPIRVSAISSARSSWNTTQPNTGVYDVAYDIWYNSQSTTGGQPDGAELMIWLNHTGTIQPVCCLRASNVSIAGSTWNVWEGNVGWNVISYVRTTPTTSVSNLDILAFTRDGVARGYINNNWYLIDVEAGFEPWVGGAGLASSGFSFTVSSGGPTPTRTRTNTPQPGATATRTPTPGAGGGISTSAWYSVINKNSGKCVDARAAGTANGTVIQQYTCNNTNAQQSQFQVASGVYYRVNNRNNSGQVWDVTGVSTADNALIQLWAYGGGNNQQWQAVSEGGGYYHFVSRNSGKCLDVPGNSTADSVQLVQFTCNGTAAQSFSLQAH